MNARTLSVLAVLGTLLAVVAPLDASAETHEAREWAEERDREEREREERESEGFDEEERFDASLPVPVVEGGRGVRAGDIVTIRWRSLGPEIEELELLLSIDGGRHVIRVSPELHGTDDHYAWRVPNIGSAEVRLRIRARVEEREVNGPEGEPFSIASDSERPREPWVFHEGSWWNEVDAAPAPLRGLLAGDHEAGFTAAGAMPTPALPTRTALLGPTLRSDSSGSCLAPVARATPALSDRDSAARSSPRRE